MLFSIEQKLYKETFMKKFLFMLIALSAPIFAQEEISTQEQTSVQAPEQAMSKALNRFGMSFDFGAGYSMGGGISMYFANDYGSFMSLGFSSDYQFAYMEMPSFYGYAHRMLTVSQLNYGGFIGGGKLYDKGGGLALGFIINIHAGYAFNDGESVNSFGIDNKSLLGNVYIGLEPGFMLAKNRFLFKLSVYADTTYGINGRMGFGFLLDNKKR